ncbi:MAG: enoyl-CoA hydratase/isomerase family protein [Candidatus Marinimicrobia bacterium]|nr:enoyl-CoA hydratase/isomerase family protein [Candidatus Neomarinimicrobiota bacterium]MBL7022688.1 enoyl-CoA hydratase/isomerase family protein [Candidatus Neomarinimicrobiota bacterium]MBL7109827.1 enoyl-CoA hydratase/isomerase family protein [Candidatus Neomarinimicrobiota bacterium]
MSALVNWTVQEDGMAFITLNSVPVNALSSQFIADLHLAVKSVKDNNNTRVVVISSSQKQFCVGMDLKEQTALSIEDGNQVVVKMNDCFNEIVSFSVPTICAINGVAAGGGGELTLSTDIRVCGENARIGFPEVGLGLIPGAGGTQRLPRLIGTSKAKYWIFSGQLFSAEEALSDGVVDFIADDNELLETAIEIASEFIKNAPLALESAKKSIDEGIKLNITLGLQKEKEAFEFTQNTIDREEGIKAFVEKRTAEWKKK